MDRVRHLLIDVKARGLAAGNFLGLVNVLLGRRLADADGAPIAAGLSWRALATLLKRIRWDKDAVRDLGVDPATLPPRDRERFWYVAFQQAGVDSAAATQAGDAFAQVLRDAGYQVGPAPGAAPPG